MLANQFHLQTIKKVPCERASCLSHHIRLFCSQLASCLDMLRLCSCCCCCLRFWFLFSLLLRLLVVLVLIPVPVLVLVIVLVGFLLVVVSCCWLLLVVVGCCSLLLFLCYQGSLQTAARCCHRSLCCSSCRAARGQWMAQQSLCQPAASCRIRPQGLTEPVRTAKIVSKHLAVVANKLTF